VQPGTILTNGGTWTDTAQGATVTLSLTQGGGTLTQNSDGSWNWSEPTPTAAGPVVITATDNLGNSTSIQFGLNVGQVFTVTNTLDDGSMGSLRWAITQVNNDPNDSAAAAQPDLIAFNINASGVQTIQVGSSQAYAGQPLPSIIQPVVLDGYTQPGSSANTMPVKGSNAGDNAVRTITLDGTSTGPSDGLAVAGGNSTVQGLIIQSFPITAFTSPRRATT
jgi:hypothetical protein